MKQVLSERIFDLGLRSWDMEKENFKWWEQQTQGGASIYLWWHCKWGIYYEWGGKGDQVYSSITLPYGDSVNIIKMCYKNLKKKSQFQMDTSSHAWGAGIIRQTLS